MFHYLRTTILILVSLLVVPAALTADEYHYINTFVGDRAAGMAGAYTGIADGPEGMYYNPAGLAFAPASYFSVSTNAFEFRNWTYQDIANTGVDFDRSSFGVVPNFFGFIQRGDQGVWGFTMFSPDATTVNLRDTYTFTLNEDYTQSKTVSQDIDYIVSELGPAYGLLLGDRMGLGFALFAGYTTEEQINRETDLFNPTDPADPGYQKHLTVTQESNLFTLRPQVGVQYMLSDELSFGFSGSVRLPIYETEGYTSSFTGDRVTDDDPQVGFQKYGITTHNIFADGIFSVATVDSRIGLAWFASPRLIVSTDVMAYLPINPANLDAEEEQQFTFNAAVGTEYYVSQNFPIRVGVFTNNANTQPVEVGAVGQPEHVDLYGVTGAVGFATADITLSLGGMYSYGIGKGQLISADPDDIQTLERSGGSIFLSGGYLF